MFTPRNLDCLPMHRLFPDKNRLSPQKSQVTIVFMPSKLGTKAVNSFTRIGKTEICPSNSEIP
jgi:hypothetical protein